MQDGAIDPSILLLPLVVISHQIANGSTAALDQHLQPWEMGWGLMDYILPITLVGLVTASLIVSMVLTGHSPLDRGVLNHGVPDLRARAIALYEMQHQQVLRSKQTVSLMLTPVTLALFVLNLSVPSWGRGSKMWPILIRVLLMGIAVVVVYVNQNKKYHLWSETDFTYGPMKDVGVGGYERPIITHMIRRGIARNSLQEIILALHQLNSWKTQLDWKIDSKSLGSTPDHKSLGEILDRLLQMSSLPRESPRQYSSEEIQLLPLLAECTADQYISGFTYTAEADEACSHTEVSHGGISALFGDLSNLKAPSQIELHIIVQLVLWRNSPFDGKYHNLWEDLQSGRHRKTGRAYSDRVLAYAVQQLRTYAITSRGSDNLEFMTYVMTQVCVFLENTYSLTFTTSSRDFLTSLESTMRT